MGLFPRIVLITIIILQYVVTAGPRLSKNVCAKSFLITLKPTNARKLAFYHEPR